MKCAALERLPLHTWITRNLRANADKQLAKNGEDNPLRKAK